MHAFTLLFMVTNLLATEPPVDGGRRPDTRSFQGSWALLSWNTDGRAVPVTEVDGKRLVIVENNCNFMLRRIVVMEGLYKLDATAAPRTIDITVADGLDEGRILLGIYTLEEDRLKLCMAHVGRARPTNFAPRDGVDITVWKHRKP